MKLYVYGLITNVAVAPIKAKPVGLLAGPVDVLPVGRVAVVASTIEDDEILPVRRNTIGHTKVLEELIERRITVLPMQFGIVLSDSDTCRHIVSTQEDAIAGLLDQLTGKIEVGITVRFNKDALFREIAAEKPSIRDRGRSLAARDEVATYHDRVALGQEVEQMIRRKHEADRAALLSRITRLCVDRKDLKAPDDLTVVRSACLVESAAEPELYAAVEAYARDREPRCDISYVAPVPAYNFVRATLDWSNARTGA